MKYKILLISSLALMLLSVEGLRAQSPTSPAKRFGIFVSGNLKLGNSHEIEGPVAVGGNLTSGQYQIKFENAYNPFKVQGAPISLAVRGAVRLNGGILRVLNNKYAKIGNCTPSVSGLNNLKVWLKDGNNSPNIIKITDVGDNYGSTQNSIELSAQATTFTPNISNDVNPVCEQVFGTGTGQIDIDAAFVNMTQRSAQLATLTDNLPIYNVDSKTTIAGPILNPSLLDQNVKIIVDPTQLNVLTVSAAVWSSIRGTVTFEKMPSGPSQPNVESSAFGVVINIINVPDVATVDGAKEVKFPNFGSLNDNHASYILYNFPDATTTLRLKGQVLFGAIFAPRADLLKANSGNLNGQVIAKTFIHESDEIHYWPYITSIPEPVKSISVTATSKCLNNAPYLDYSITPTNFDATGQTAQIEWINSAGTVVRTDAGQPASGSLLFPGAALGADGNGNAWPGWVLNGDTYEPSTDLNSTIKDAGATIKVTLDQIETISISYPAGSNGCLVSPPPPPHKITVVATSKCLDNAPYLDYSITPNFDATGQTATIEWINSAGVVVREDAGQSISGSLLFPGAALGTDGKGNAWPGWVLNGDVYEPSNDLNATIKDPGATIRVTLDKTQSIEISYPAGSIGCLVSPPPPPHKITVLATSKCLNDAPYLDYSISPNFDATGLTAKIEWINSEGTVVREDAGQLLSGTLLFPGAAVGANGKGNAWPGWVLNGTTYVPLNDLNSTIRNAGATIRVTINPTETVSITYPPAAPGCLVSPPPTTPLPVTLSSFTAKNENCNVQLKWTITEAKNFSHFDVERSTDAKSFISLNSVNYDAARKDYTAVDSPFSGETTPAKYYYYRLKQVDMDDTFEYSSIRSVDAGTCDSRLSVTFYPNPTQNEINVKSGSPVKMLEIVSIAGKQIYKINPSQSVTDLKVDVQSLTQGLYIVNIINTEGTYSSKILKK